MSDSSAGRTQRKVIEIELEVDEHLRECSFSLIQWSLGSRIRKYAVSFIVRAPNPLRIRQSGVFDNCCSRAADTECMGKFTLSKTRSLLLQAEHVRTTTIQRNRGRRNRGSTQSANQEAEGNKKVVSLTYNRRCVDEYCRCTQLSHNQKLSYIDS